jgi:uncharacterized membrane protein
MSSSRGLSAIASRTAARVGSIDILRGAVMVLMAIDHVRVYSGVPAGGQTPGVFFTRWVTHFCAPGFVLFAGTAAYLHGQKLGNRAALSRWLLLRGLWLVFLELTWMRLCWTFNLDFSHYLLAGVLWAIGWCLVLLAGLIYLPLPVVGGFGLVVIALHDLVDPHLPALTALAQKSGAFWLWQTLYFPFGSIGPLAILYTLVPWVGVMAVGYAFGRLVDEPPERRRRLCFAIGGAAIAAFLVLRGFDLYGDPRPWREAAAPSLALLRFLNTSKYPASLLFLLMTLGPLILSMPLFDGAPGVWARVLAVFGRVPLFYYLLHIPLIHALALLVSLLREGRLNPWLFANHPLRNPPASPEYQWSLPLLFAVTAIAVALLYWPCRWFAELKRTRRWRWAALL